MPLWYKDCQPVELIPPAANLYRTQVHPYRSVFARSNSPSLGSNDVYRWFERRAMIRPVDWQDRDKAGGVRRLIISVHLSREWPENWKRNHGETMSDIRTTEFRLVSVI